MSKSEKSAYFRQVFANNFFLVHFVKPFFRLWLQMRRKRLKKTENRFFYGCVLEFTYATIKGFA
jgi:hypothetical protein